MAREHLYDNVTIQGDPSVLSRVEVRVEQGKGLIIDLQKDEPTEEHVPIIMPSQNEVFVAWPEETVDASSDESSDGEHDLQEAAERAWRRLGSRAECDQRLRGALKG